MFWIIKKYLMVFYLDSIINLMAVRSSPSITTSVNAGIHTKFLPLGATKPRVTPQNWK